jgi:hypothetical protein
MAHATEAHVFITDLNQSPFNVGVRLALEDFDREQVADLNRRHGAPLRDDHDLNRFYALLGGHPYLARLGLYEMTVHDLDLEELEAGAGRDEGPFGDHLRRVLTSLTRSPDLAGTVREALQGGACPTPDSFHRLRSAGVLAGDSARSARLRCGLCARYLARHLARIP